MSKDLRKKVRVVKSSSPKKTYEVGYAKPPNSTKFQKGKSGNPRGRPKGSKNQTPALHEERFKTLIMEEAYRTVKVNEGDKQITIPIAQAIVRSMAVNAVRGDQRAQKTFTDLLSWVETDNKAHYDEYAQAILDHKYDWEREFERLQSLGLPIPEIYPRPSDIKLDPQSGVIRVTGPWSKEDKKQWDKLKERKDQSTEAIAAYKAEIANSDDEKFKRFMEDEIALEEWIYEIISKSIGDYEA